MKHIVITGANRGIGLEMVRQSLAQGHQVTALCRRRSAIGYLGVTVHPQRLTRSGHRRWAGDSADQRHRAH